MDLNPVDLLPSACIPCIPHVERRDMLNMYGDAESTLSISTFTVDPVAVGLPDGAPVLGFLIIYLNVLSVGISVIKNEPLNLDASVPVTPSINTGVPTENP